MNSSPSSERMRHWDVVLVDDDQLVRATWKLMARKAGKTALLYASADELLANIDSIKLDTPIYIDFRLGNDNVQGVALAERLYQKGFSQLYFSTGIEKDEVPAMEIIKGVRGKNPPWTL